MDRVILHCDCNSFFASVETALNPAYRDVPMAVCGSQEDRHGIVLAKNALAARYGISTAETVYSAKRRCPNLVVVKPHYHEYIKYSKMVNAIYAEYTDVVEPFGIDESWLDVTASRRVFGSGLEIAEQIRKRVKEEIGITVSIGVSFNKVFAKLGSDYKKPDAVTVIDYDNFKDIVYPLSVDTLLYVGKRTKDILLSLGIKTIGDLAAAKPTMLINKLGKSGEMLLRYAQGLDDAPVLAHQDDAKSVGNGFTFRHDLVTPDEIRMGIDFLCAEIGRRLRDKGIMCTTVSVSIKDDMLDVIQRQRPLLQPTDIGGEIADTAYAITMSAWGVGKPIRTITVTATGLVKGGMLADQMDMFSVKDNDEVRSKRRMMEKTVDDIRRRYGGASLVRGVGIDSDIGIYKPKDAE